MKKTGGPTQQSQEAVANRDTIHVPDYTQSQSNAATKSAQAVPNEVLDTLISIPRDALGLLFKAADHATSDSSGESDSPHVSRQYRLSGTPYRMPSPTLTLSDTLRLWEKHRFVRQGWFTSREAVSYCKL